MWQTVENKQKFISQIMTSKSPARSADDIDATALSYAEIKALSASNPYIKEKMELDTEVAKLKMVRTSFMNEKYALEDKVIKYYPQKIASLTQALKGYEKDLSTISQYPQQEDKFYTMTIDGLGYTEKKQAGEALIERCKKITTEDEIHIGDYRGFSMSVEYNEFYSSFKLNLKAEMTYSVYLGADIYGNIQRIDNALADIGEEIDKTRRDLEDTKTQFEVAKVDSRLEFPQETELTEKLERLAKLDALLNMDKKGNDKVIMAEPGDSETIPLKKAVGMER